MCFCWILELCGGRLNYFCCGDMAVSRLFGAMDTTVFYLFPLGIQGLS